jgi:hypothetical protein
MMTFDEKRKGREKEDVVGGESRGRRAEARGKREEANSRYVL